jgi:hypothetical protein
MTIKQWGRTNPDPIIEWAPLLAGLAAIALLTVVLIIAEALTSN